MAWLIRTHLSPRDKSSLQLDQSLSLLRKLFKEVWAKNNLMDGLLERHVNQAEFNDLKTI